MLNCQEKVRSEHVESKFGVNVSSEFGKICELKNNLTGSTLQGSPGDSGLSFRKCSTGDITLKEESLKGSLYESGVGSMGCSNSNLGDCEDSLTGCYSCMEDVFEDSCLSQESPLSPTQDNLLHAENISQDENPSPCTCTSSDDHFSCMQCQSEVV